MDLGIELGSYMRYLAALAFVLLLLWGGAWLMRRAMSFRFGVHNRTRNQKLHILEILSIDGRNKLVRIQYDDQEQLLLLGQNHAMRLSPESVSADRSAGADLRVLAEEEVHVSKGAFRGGSQG